MNPQKKMSYAEAKDFAIQALLRAIEAHNIRQYEDIRKEFDKFDCGLPRGAGPEFDKLVITLNFLDGWYESSGHDWNFYEPLVARDWPILAEEIVEDLRSNQEIKNSEVLRQFDFKNRPQSASLIQQIKEWIGLGSPTK